MADVFQAARLIEQTPALIPVPDVMTIDELRRYVPGPGDKKQVKLMATQYGRASQQYKNAIQYQASLVMKQMTGK